MVRHHRLLTFLIIALLAIQLSPTSLPARAQEATGLLRAVHFLTGAPKVDVFLDGAVVLANLGYQDATAYVPVTVGTHELNFSVAGQNKPGSSPITLEVAANDLFTFVFSGTLADKAPDVYVTSESGLAQRNNMTLFGDTMPLLFVQAAKDAGEVDVYVNDQPAGTVKNAESLLVNVPLTAYSLKVTAAGDASKVLKDTMRFGLVDVTGVMGLTGTATDGYSLDAAYSTPADAAQFFASQSEHGALKFDSLAAAAATAQLDTMLTGAGPLTIFAPEDSAFAKIDTASLSSDALNSVVSYHIILSPLVYDDILTLLMTNGAQKTLQGADMTFGLTDAVVLGGTPIKLIVWNIHTSNAVIHVIDSVLMPPKS